MKHKLILIIFFSLLISCSTDDDDYGINDRDDNVNLFSNKARVVGYFPYYRFSLNNQIEYCKVTHLNIAFANPVADGTIDLPSTDNTTLSDVVNRARSQNSNIKYSYNNIDQSKDSISETFILSSGSKFLKNEINCNLNGKYSSAFINGVFSLDADKHHEIRTSVNH